MYHPYLFARRSELLALRDLADKLDVAQTISPILEAVKSDPQDLLKCLRVLGKADIFTSVITNPHEGDFKNVTTISAWRSALTATFCEFPTILPAFICRPTSTVEQIDAFFHLFADSEVVILYWSPKISDQALSNLASRENIRFHINLHNQMSHLRRFLLPVSKSVDVNDHFAKCARNADYGGPEFFSDDHLSYQNQAIGFGDFSITGPRFVQGGGQAHAVAIHALYQADGGALWVEHFISDDTDIEVGTVEGKYLQAAGKLFKAVQERPSEFGDDAALRGFSDDVRNETYPGLATSKRRQIYHHCALIHGILSDIDEASA